MPLTNIIYLTKLQYDTLLTQGSIIVGDVTYTYDPNADYRIPLEISDYTSLDNKPQINGITLVGNKTLNTLNIISGENVAFTQTLDSHTIISATDTQYTAGTNVSIDNNNVISATDTTYTAGTNITIENNVISATGSGGTSDYTQLTNKPKINNVELSGNKTTSDLGITIPTKTSDLTNDSGFLTSHQDISGKLDKVTEATSINRVYAVNGLGNQTMYNVTYGASANSLIMRSNEGQVIVKETPTSNDHATSKQYVDNALSSKLDKWAERSSYYYHFYGTVGSDEPSQTMLNGSHTGLGYQGNVPIFKNGSILKANGTATEYNDLTNKQYVDNALATKQNTLIAGTNITIAADGKTISATDTTNYTSLSNKPSINSVTLSGNKSLSDLSLYSKSEVDSLLQGITQFDFQIVTSLPTIGVKGTIYLIAHSPSSTQNIYDEYIWIKPEDQEGYFELFGSTQIDVSTKLDKVSDSTSNGSLYYTNSSGQSTLPVSPNLTNNAVVQRDASSQIKVPSTPTANNHATSKTYVDTALSNKQDTLTAGTGISITNNTISTTLTGLPSVTSADNDKILQVVNGIWTAVSVPNANNEEF